MSVTGESLNHLTVELVPLGSEWGLVGRIGKKVEVGSDPPIFILLHRPVLKDRLLCAPLLSSFVVVVHPPSQTHTVRRERDGQRVAGEH